MSGRRGEEKILHTTRTRTLTPLSSSPQPVAIATTLLIMKTVGGDSTYMNAWEIKLCVKLAAPADFTHGPLSGFHAV
jgi:hypothetical protein